MKKRSKYVNVVLACFLLTEFGCAAHRSIVVKPAAGHRFSEYETLEVPTFQSVVKGDLDTNILTAIPDQLVKEMRKKTLFKEVTRLQSSAPGTVIMNCNVVSIDKGSR